MITVCVFQHLRLSALGKLLTFYFEPRLLPEGSGWLNYKLSSRLGVLFFSIEVDFFTKASFIPPNECFTELYLFWSTSLIVSSIDSIFRGGFLTTDLLLMLSLRMSVARALEGKVCSWTGFGVREGKAEISGGCSGVFPSEVIDLNIF